MRPRAAKSAWTHYLHCSLVWLLCLCSWRAPVPVLHYHGDGLQALSESTISQSTAQLLKHLELFHVNAVDLAHAHWHLHFVVPSPVSNQGCPDNDAVPVQPLSPPNSTTSSFVDLAVDDSVHIGSPTSDDIEPVSARLNNQAPRLIPLASPRVRPKRLSPVIAFCVSRC